jgi:DNA-binding SARP family transcriptional activator
MMVASGVPMCSVSMLGAFAFRVDGRDVQLPRAAERVVAFLALQRRPVPRHRVAGVLWPDVPEERSLGSLRSALWRLRQLAEELVVVGDVQLRLAADTELDTDVLSDQSHRLVGDRELDIGAVDVSQFGSELLPGWYDDWVVFERERLRQLSLHGLEALSRRQSAGGRHADAVESAWRAISLEPLRESAHATLVHAHLAEGNVCEAVRRYRALAELLRAELGIEPGAELTDRIDAAMSGPSGRC